MCPSSPPLMCSWYSPRNDFFFCYCSEYIGMGGGGGGFAFVVDGDLSGGTSGVSDTFGNSILSSGGVFHCKNFELWCFH
jgi:hypothetical protein